MPIEVIAKWPTHHNYYGTYTRKVGIQYGLYGCILSDETNIRHTMQVAAVVLGICHNLCMQVVDTILWDNDPWNNINKPYVTTNGQLMLFSKYFYSVVTSIIVMSFRLESKKPGQWSIILECCTSVPFQVDWGDYTYIHTPITILISLPTLLMVHLLLESNHELPLDLASETASLLTGLNMYCSHTSSLFYTCLRVIMPHNKFNSTKLSYRWSSCWYIDLSKPPIIDNLCKCGNTYEKCTYCQENEKHDPWDLPIPISRDHSRNGRTYRRKPLRRLKQ